MKKVIYITVIIIIAFFFIALIPVDRSKANCVEVSGVVKSISEGGVKDLVFELENDPITYYINRGFENGFEIAKTKKDFEGNKVTLFYVDSWTIFAPFGTTSKDISYLAINDSIIYNEW